MPALVQTFIVSLQIESSGKWFRGLFIQSSIPLSFVMIILVCVAIFNFAKSHSVFTSSSLMEVQLYISCVMH